MDTRGHVGSVWTLNNFTWQVVRLLCFVLFWWKGVFYKHILGTSTVSSTNSGQYSYFQAALLVLVIYYYVGEFLLDGRGPIILSQKKHLI